MSEAVSAQERVAAFINICYTLIVSYLVQYTRFPRFVLIYVTAAIPISVYLSLKTFKYLMGLSDQAADAFLYDQSITYGNLSRK